MSTSKKVPTYVWKQDGRGQDRNGVFIQEKSITVAGLLRVAEDAFGVPISEDSQRGLILNVEDGKLHLMRG